MLAPISPPLLVLVAVGIGLAILVAVLGMGGSSNRHDVFVPIL